MSVFRSAVRSIVNPARTAPAKRGSTPAASSPPPPKPPTPATPTPANPRWRLTPDPLTGSGCPGSPRVALELQGVSLEYSLPPENLLVSQWPLANRTFAGPATLQLLPANCGSSPKAFVTVEILPSAFPPDKALTLGAFSGNVQVTMEESTDLVNWTAAQNGATYTNAPDARFFRIRMTKNAPPPP